ncbi:hypothetical protein FO519_003682 [Halicephalobus sp. NKZ332]|nr:hypothetical protein FO519_003682 [Halicephalobus sp. NKZ332]
MTSQITSFTVFYLFLLLVLPYSEAGTWLSFTQLADQKTGGLEGSSFEVPVKSVNPSRVNPNELMGLWKDCDKFMKKRSEYFPRFERRDADICKTVFGFVSR